MVAHLETVLIPCSSSAGMFDSERAVEIDTLDAMVSLFADQGLIVGKAESKPFLRTYAPGANLSDDTPVQVLLPSEAFETGTR